MIVAIDFDHTLCDTANVEPGHKMGPPMDGALEALKQIARSNSVIIFSARATNAAGKRSIEEWLKYYGVSDYVHMVTAIKIPSVHVFIDDRGYRFQNWQQTLRDLPSLLAYDPDSSNQSSSGRSTGGSPSSGLPSSGQPSRFGGSQFSGSPS